MVFRYWGDVHADPQEFAPIVDRRAGGIANGALVDAVRRRGWQAVALAGGSADLQARLDARQPVVVLIADRGPRYHYVVAVGKTADAVVIHDPAWGPSRAIKDVEFDRLWRASGNWGVVILPPPAAFLPDLSASPSAQDGGATLSGPESHCDRLLAAALDDIRTSGDAAFDRADDVLKGVRHACPQSAGPLRELAGVRFAQRRWKDAVALSRDALVREPTDAYALDVLGSSLFMQEDEVGALRAWNRIDRPRVNLVRIAGVRHTRYQTIAETLGIQPNMKVMQGKKDYLKDDAGPYYYSKPEYMQMVFPSFRISFCRDGSGGEIPDSVYLKPLRYGDADLEAYKRINNGRAYTTDMYDYVNKALIGIKKTQINAEKVVDVAGKMIDMSGIPDMPSSSSTGDPRLDKMKMEYIGNEQKEDLQDELIDPTHTANTGILFNAANGTHGH